MLRRLLVTVGGCLAAVLLSAPIRAQTVPPPTELPSVRLLTAPLVTPTNAWNYYNSLPATTAPPTKGASAWAARPAEIQELARALGGTRIPGTYSNQQYEMAVYEYIRNNIAVEFRFGLSKGARGALIDQSGTPFDQAHLMVELLRQANISASYKVDAITLLAPQFTAWTGISNALAACHFLADGGIPATVNSQSDCSVLGTTDPVSTVTLGHIWVQTNEGIYDPSYKVYTAKSGIDLASVMGCGTAANPTCATNLLSTSLVPAITQNCTGFAGVNCVTAVSQSGIETQLRNYATALENYIKAYNSSNAAYLSLEDVVGGYVIDTTQLLTSGSLLPASTYPTTTAYTWSGDIPDTFRTTLTVYFDGITRKMYADELAGNRLKIWGAASRTSSSQTTTATRIVSLYLEGRPLDQNTLTLQTGAIDTLTLSTTHPYAANGGAYASEVVAFPVKIQSEDCETTLNAPCSGVWHMGVVTVLNGWGEQTESSVSQAGDLQRRDKGNGYPWENITPTIDSKHIFLNYTAKGGGCLQTNAVVTQPTDHNFCYQEEQGSLGTSWLAEASRVRVLAGNINGVAMQHHHSLGIVFSGLSIESNETIFNVQSSVSGQSRTAVAADRTAAFASAVVEMNRLEGGVMEQSFGAWEGGAGVSMMARSNDHSIPFLEVNSGNATQVHNQFASSFSTYNYWSSDLDAISNYATAGFSVIVPANGHAGDYPFPNGSLSFGSNGIAAFGGSADRIAYLATLGPTLVKGSGGTVTDDPANEAEKSTKLSDYALKSRKSYGVDLASGDLQLTVKPDMVTGTGDFPASLSYQRVYSTSRLGVTNTEWSNSIYAAPSQPDPAAIGGGWTHTLAIVAQIQSDGFAGMGRDGALPASGTIAGMFVQRWLQKGTVDMRSRLANVFTSHWMANALNRNVFTVSRPPARNQFTLLPDGSYDPGPGSAEKLTLTTGVQSMIGLAGTSWWWYGLDMRFSLVDKSGSTMTFQQFLPTGNAIYLSYPADWPFVPTTWTFPSGIALSFTYKTDGAAAGFNRACLIGVANNLGRSFTFNDPCAGTLTSTQNATGAQWVQDDSGRRVTFASSPNNLGAGNWMSSQETSLTTLTVTGPDGAVNRYDYTWAPPSGVPTRRYGGLARWFTPGDPNNPYVTVNYDSMFRVSSTTDNAQPNAQTTQYFIGGMYATQVQKRSDVVEPTALAPLTTTWLDQWGQQTKVMDPLDRITYFAYDSSRRLTKKTYPEGNSDSYTYDARSNRLTEALNPKGGSSLASQITTTTYVEGPTVASCSNTATCNLPATVDGPRSDVNDVTTFSYNSDGSMSRVVGPSVAWVDSDGGSGTGSAQTDYCYTANTGTSGSINLLTGKIIKTGSSTRVTAYAYNSAAAHLSLQSLTSDPATTLVAPASAGGACTSASRANPVSLTTALSYTSTGDVSAIDGPLDGTSDTISYSYDLARRLTREVHPSALLDGVTKQPIVRYTYDADGQLTTKRRSIAVTPIDSDPTNSQPGDLVASEWSTEVHTYWPTGDLKSVQDPAGNLTQYTYDAVGRQVVVLNPDGLGTSTVYDAAGQVSCTWHGWDNLSPAVNCVWDPAGYSPTAPMRYSAVTYTANGKQKTIQDANSNTTENAYDSLDRPIFVAYPQPGDGSRCALPSNEAGTPSCSTNQTYEQYGYDAANNRVSIRTRNGDIITFAYNAENRRISKSVPGVPVVTESYNLDAEPIQSSNPATGGFAAHSTSYAYDGAGRRLSETNDGLTVSYIFDKAGNRSRLTWPDSYFVSYEYDVLDNLKYARENSTTGNEIAFYDYDTLVRRKQTCLGGQSSACTAHTGTNEADYTYEPDNDLNGIAHSFNGGSLSLAYQRDAAHRIKRVDASDSFYLVAATATDSATYSPNHLNEYASIDGQSAQYDNNGNLLSWSVPDTGAVQSYSYDAESHLRTVTITGAGAATISYDYDSMGRRVSKTVNGVTTRYLLDDADEIAEYDGATLLRRYLPGAGVDERIARAEGSAVTTPTKTFYRTNHQGTVIAITDAAGVVVQRFSYDEYGVPSSGTAATGEPFRYTGRRYDPETGLYYYRARNYAPMLGRFLQGDPAGGKDDLNLYSYVNNNPLNSIDPTGLYDSCADFRDHNPSGSCWEEDVTDSAKYLARTAKWTAGGAVAGGVTAFVLSLPLDGATAGGNVALTPAEVAGGVALGGYLGMGAAALTNDTEKYLRKFDKEVDAILARTDLGPYGEQYALRAKVDGIYPDVRLGTVHLMKGEVWKYGESINGDDRYLQSYYDHVGPGVKYDMQYRGTQMQAKVMEKVRLYGFFFVYKTLPPGNCCFK